MKIKQLTKDSIHIKLKNNEEAVIYRFGKTCYSVTSEGLYKKDLINIKKDCLLYNFDAEKLRKLYYE